MQRRDPAHEPALTADEAWLAGLIEGEGSLHRKVDRRYGNVSWELAVSSTDADVIFRAFEVARVGNLTFARRQRAHWQDQHRWLVTRRDHILLVIVRVYPLLGRRRSAKTQEFVRWYWTTIRSDGP